MAASFLGPCHNIPIPRPFHSPMQIRQIQARHDELQDRILLRFSTADDCEFQFWLTRRFMKRFWPVLLKMLEHDEPVRQQRDGETRRAVLSMRHEAFRQESDFSTAFKERTYQRPLGADPVLVGRADCTPHADGLTRLSLRPLQGQGIDLTLDARMLHSICKLLTDALAKADWDLDIKIPQVALEATAAAGHTPRTLN
jgi:hypothetical protein